jgi:hypothetical protein
MISVGKPEGKRPLGRCKRTWEDIKIVLKGIVCEDVEWNQVAQDRDQWLALLNKVTNIQVP